jgi:hypothetical protein
MAHGDLGGEEAMLEGEDLGILAARFHGGRQGGVVAAVAARRRQLVGHRKMAPLNKNGRTRMGSALTI